MGEVVMVNRSLGCSDAFQVELFGPVRFSLNPTPPTTRAAQSLLQIPGNGW